MGPAKKMPQKTSTSCARLRPNLPKSAARRNLAGKHRPSLFLSVVADAQKWKKTLCSSDNGSELNVGDKNLMDFFLFFFFFQKKPVRKGNWSRRPSAASEPKTIFS